jgi:DNA-directed RNA polymerase specialized sigma24 family protein
MSIDQDFTDFVGVRWAALYRLAYLLTGSPTGAEDLLQTTLEKAYMNWARIGRMAEDSLELPLLDRSLLWPLVCALPARQRAVIVLRYYEDLSEAQIADVLGCAPGTVKSQTSAAFAALRRALAAAGIGQAVENP